MSLRSGWQWKNIPVPEAHLVAIGTSLALQRAHPWRKSHAMCIREGGAIVTGAGIAIAAWATRSAGDIELGQSGDLVTGGAYAFSRHPMYVGWTLVYLGYGLLAESAWPLILFPGLAGWVHWTILGEERRVEERFGSRYRDYVCRVPRYFWEPGAGGI